MTEPRMFQAKPGPWLLQVRFLLLISFLLTQPAQSLGEGTPWPENCTVRSSWCSGTQPEMTTMYVLPSKYSCDNESRVTAGLLNNESAPIVYGTERSVANWTFTDRTVAVDKFVNIDEQDFTPCEKKDFVPVYLRRAANISFKGPTSESMCLVLEAPESMILKVKRGSTICQDGRVSLFVKEGDTWSIEIDNIYYRGTYVYYTRDNVNWLIMTLDNCDPEVALQVEVVPAASRPSHFHAFCYADKKGYIQTPADWDGLTKYYSPSTRSCITLEVPDDHVIMISFIDFDIETTGSCRYDIFSIHMDADCQDAGTKICYAKDFSPTVYGEDRRTVAFYFQSDYSIQDRGFRILYSFHPTNAKPEKLSDGKWNCSVPYFSDFQEHFMCSVEVFCADGRDKQRCGYSDICGKISGDVTKYGPGQCFHIFSHLPENITWNNAADTCKRAGLRLVRLDSKAKWQSFLNATKDLPENSVFVGFKRAPPTDPEMYRLTWRFTDDTLAIAVNVSSNKLYEDCGRILRRDRNALSSVQCTRQPIKAAFACEPISVDLAQDDSTSDANSLLPALPVEQATLFELITELYGNLLLLAKCRHNHTAHASLACDVTTNCSAAADDVLRCASNSRFSPPVPLFECDMGSQFLPYSLVCDHREDCCDGSDELFCYFPPCNEKELQCKNKRQCVSRRYECDGESNCVDGSDEFQCSGEQIPRRSWADQRKALPPVIVKFDGRGDFSAAALNSTACPESHFRCPGTEYCLPVYVLCNGVFDCPDRQDEKGCDYFTCPGFYRCRKSRVCVHHDNLCDKTFHCPQHDDELHCYLECPDNCTCYGYAFICTGQFLVETHGNSLRYVDASDTGMTPANFSKSLRLNHLTLRRCEITAIGTVDLPNLQTLDLTDNRLTVVTSSELNQLKNLRYLLLARNPLVSLDPMLDNKHVFPNIYELNVAMVNIVELTVTFFETFPNLRVLNLSDSNLKLVPESGFQSLKELHKLDLRECSLRKIPRGIFDGLEKLQNVFSCNYKLCCPSVLPAGFDSENCFAPTDEVSSCDALLRSEMFRVFLAIYALLSLVGNLGSFIYRNVIERAAVRMGFDVFVTHLCVADFLMGVYLAIIGVADRIYYGDYIWNDLTWRHSAACKIAGFLSFLSSEMSAFLICLITLERFLVLRFPFSSLRFNRKSAHVTCIALWIISLVLSAVPLLPTLEHWQFYSQSGICIPLPITRKSFPGTDYSFGIMIGLNFVLFLLIAVGQSLIYHSIRSNTMTSKSSSKSKDMTIAHRLLAIVMTDFFCWFPIGMLGIMARNGVAISGDINVGMAIFVLPFNSALNPFLYTFNVIMERRRKARQDRLSKIEKTQYTSQSPATTSKAEAKGDREKMWTESEALMFIDELLDARILSKDAMKNLRQRFGDVI